MKPKRPTPKRRPDGKLTKAESDYGPGKPEEHCGICEHYEHDGDNTCSIVAGYIDPQMWCKYFQ